MYTVYAHYYTIAAIIAETDTIKYKYNILFMYVYPEGALQKGRIVKIMFVCIFNPN